MCFLVIKLQWEHEEQGLLRFVSVSHLAVLFLHLQSNPITFLHFYCPVCLQHVATWGYRQRYLVLVDVGIFLKTNNLLLGLAAAGNVQPFFFGKLSTSLSKRGFIGWAQCFQTEYGSERCVTVWQRRRRQIRQPHVSNLSVPFAKFTNHRN